MELRKLNQIDLPILFQLIQANKKVLLPWIKWVETINTLDDLSAWYQQIKAPIIYLVMVEQQVVGMTDISQISHENKRGEVGIWLAKNVQKKGYAKKALLKLEDIASKQYGLSELEMMIAPDNQASLRLATNLNYCEQDPITSWKDQRIIWRIFNKKIKKR